MSYKLIFSDEAVLDIEEVFVWYADIELALAENFEKELYTTLESVRHYPQSFQTIQKNRS